MLDNFEHLVEAADDLAGLLAAVPTCACSSRAASCCGCRASRRTRCRRSSRPTGPSSSSPGREQPIRVQPGRSRLPSSARGSSSCRSRSSSPRRGSGCSRPSSCSTGSAQRLDLLKAGRGVDPRQQTLRATIEWSHELLDEDEQPLFARLAVFRGGCDARGSGAGLRRQLDVLESLVDKSLVRVRDGERFWMLETIREFALERLEASGEAEGLRERHAELFLELCEAAEPELLGVDPKPALDRLEPELENIRAALDWLEGAGPRTRCGSAGATMEFWCLRNRWGEGWRRIERLLATGRDANAGSGQGDGRCCPSRASRWPGRGGRGA